MAELQTTHTLHALLNPRKIAVIGASNNSEKVGYAIMKNLIDFCFSGEIIPINTHEEKVFGKKAFYSVKDCNKKIDLAIIAVPAAIVPKIIEECALSKIKNVIIISAGFSETGIEGKKLEEEIKHIAHTNKMTIIGPNTLGVINTHSRLNASFANAQPKKGGLAVISQSGALCTAILDWAKLENVGFSTFISTGNKTFIDEAHYFDYLEKDPNTKTVIVYMESVHKPEQFLRHAAKLAKTKPVVILKAGRFALGQRAAASHTGAMSIDDNIFTIACKKANIIRATTIEEFFDLAKLFGKLTNPQGFRLGVVTNAGGPGVIAADAAENYKFKLPEFSVRTIRAVSKINPNPQNPLDLIGDAKPIDYKTAISTLQSDIGIDIIYALLTPQSMTNPFEVAQIIVSLNKRKPIISSFLGGAGVESSIKYLKENQAIVFETPERGICALSQLNEYYLNKRRPENFVHSHLTKRRIDKTILGKDKIILHDALRIIKSEGIATPQTRFFESTEEISKAEFNFPVVIKAASGRAHKTDLGLIKTNISSQKELLTAAFDMFEKLIAIGDSRIVAVQEVIAGQEVIVSAIDTPFGKTITYGLGGIFVEVMRDYSQKIAPLTDGDIDAMLDEVKGSAVLLGARTNKKYNIGALKQTIKAVSKIILTYPQIKELEINPLIVNEEGAFAADCIIRV